MKSVICDFLLTFHSNHGLLSYRFPDGDFGLKLQKKIFSAPVYFAPPADGVPLELGIRALSQKTRMMGLPEGPKSFKIDLAI